MTLLPRRLTTWRAAATTAVPTALWLLAGPRLVDHDDYVTVLLIGAALTAALWVRHLAVRDRYRRACTERHPADIELWRWVTSRFRLLSDVPSQPAPERWSELHRRLHIACRQVGETADHLPAGLGDRLHVAVQADLLLFVDLYDRRALAEAEQTVREAEQVANELLWAEADHRASDADLADTARVVLEVWHELEVADQTTPHPDVS